MEKESAPARNREKVITVLYGLFRLLRGMGWMSSGANIHGSVADLGQGWF